MAGGRVGVVWLLSQQLLAQRIPAYLIASSWTWEYFLPQALKSVHLEAIAIGINAFIVSLDVEACLKGPHLSLSVSPVYYLLNYWLFFGSPVLQSTGNSSALNEVSKMIDNGSVIISACSLRTFRWDYLSLLICEHLVCHHHILCSFSPAQTTASLIVFSLSYQLNQKYSFKCKATNSVLVHTLWSLSEISDKGKIQIRAHISLREMCSGMLQSIPSG